MDAPPPLPEPARLLRQLEQSDGRLTVGDADLLIGAAIQALTASPAPQVAAEVGTPCARTALVLELVARAVAPSARMVTVDPCSAPPPREREQEGDQPPALLVVGDGPDFASVTAGYSHVEARLRPGGLVVLRGSGPAPTGSPAWSTTLWPRAPTSGLAAPTRWP